jgi:aminopeptidase N
MDVAAFADGAQTFRAEVSITSDVTRVESLASVAPTDLVVPNAGDLTWATVALDEVTVAALPEGLASVPDAQARAVVWVALVDGVCLGRVDPRLMVRTFGNAWAREDNDSVLNRTSLVLLNRVIPTFLPPAERDWAERVVAGAATTVLGAAAPGSTRALLAARTVARASHDESLLQGWALGKDRPLGLEDDTDFGWLAVRTLASRGMVDRDFIEARRAQDDTLQGRLNALTAGASMPSADAKAWAWSQLTQNRERSNYELNALAQGFWHGAAESVVQPYAARYFTDVPAMTAWVGEDAIARVAHLAYPATVVQQATADLSAATLNGASLSAAVRRAMVDGESELREALRSRATFG